MIFYALLFFAVAYFFTACTKTKNVVTTIHDSTTVVIRDTIVKIDTLVMKNPKNPITGYWVGTYTIDQNVAFGAFYYAFAIFPDHTIVEQGGGPNGVVWTARGTWTLAADSTFNADITSTDPSEGPTLTGHNSAKYSSVDGTLTNGHTAYTSGNPQTSSFTLKRTGDQ